MYCSSWDEDCAGSFTFLYGICWFVSVGECDQFPGYELSASPYLDRSIVDIRVEAVKSIAVTWLLTLDASVAFEYVAPTCNSDSQDLGHHIGLI